MARWLPDCFSSKKKNRQTLCHPTPIAIRSQSPDNTKATRWAILACDISSESNIISQQLVIEVLGEQYHALDEQSMLAMRITRYGEKIDGYVYLDWRWESNMEQWHSTRFFVTNTSDPPYDAVLGKKDAEYYGMTKPRRKR
ncbi:hypothetical protein GQ44DRAFT_778439 [Phaeosphaeriaceae sp. PMI808]|nr:hypothetical protein GQ44DRAFT_778439 [Phaeosphaeriaceae sp. PMI808]